MNELITNGNFDIDYITVHQLVRREKLKKKKGKKITPSRGLRKILITFQKEDFSAWEIKDNQ